MASDDLTRLLVSRLSALIERREVSPVEVTEAYLRHIDETEPRLNAFITRMDDRATESARHAEAEIMRGGYRGPLHGVPVGLKDLFHTRGVRTTSGSAIDRDFVPDEDSAVTERFAAAGAIVVGKLHMTELAFDGTSLNRHYGPARNPWDTERMAGGSSSGSGVAVAAGQAALAVGTDTGGSVRVPAALCGVTGLKPTFGLISRYGATPLSWSMDHVGPLARSVLDSALALNALAGHDPRDPASLRVQPRDYAAGLERGTEGAAGTRVGVVESFGWDLTEPGVKTAFDSAMARLGTLGVDVKPAVTPELALVNAAGSVVQTAEAAALHRARVLSRGREMDQAIRRRIESGLFIPAEAYLHAQRVRAMLRRELLSTLEEVDLLASPTTAIAAPRLEQQSVMIQGREVHIREGLLRITRVFSAVGLPAISVPCGFTEDGLPVGLQLVGKPLSEPLLLRVAHAYQASTEWHTRFPDV